MVLVFQGRPYEIAFICFDMLSRVYWWQPIVTMIHLYVYNIHIFVKATSPWAVQCYVIWNKMSVDILGLTWLACLCKATGYFFHQISLEHNKDVAWKLLCLPCTLYFPLQPKGRGTKRYEHETEYEQQLEKWDNRLLICWKTQRKAIWLNRQPVNHCE